MIRRCLAIVSVVLGGAVLLSSADAGGQNAPKEKEFRMAPGTPEEVAACIECHRREHPGLFADWADSRHASAGITCYDCHQAEPSDPDVSKMHEEQYGRSDLEYGREHVVPVSAVVTPKDCAGCHPDESEQYSISKHANTLEIMWKVDPWLNGGMNSDIERTTGCYYCHGTVVRMKDGELDPETWPNVGVGRINFDGSRGSCTSCHTRHRFSLMEARKPEACGQCHLGPDHPHLSGLWG